MTSNIVLSTEEFEVVGSRPIRHDGTDKVTGRAQYSADIQLPGLLQGKILRSPHPHARIKSIDTSRALALPGVRAVVTSQDFPQPSGKVMDLGEGAMANPRFLSNNCLAADKALYKGHAVAAVAADSLHLAEEALSLIDVDYEVLKPVVNVLEAMKEDAPVLHERLANLSNPNMRPGGLRSDDDTGKATNIANHFVFEVGDIEQGFQEADVIVEREFKTASVHQGYIEPHSATALWNADGNLTIWCSSQGHFNVRDQTSNILGMPVSKVRVIPMEIGGGFGGKTLVYLEPVAAALSRKTGRPVKVTMGRAEVFEGTGPTSGSYMKDEDGRHQRWAHHGGGGDPGLRSRCLPRLAGEPRRPVHAGPLRHSQRPHRRLRRGSEQAQDRRLPGARRARRRLRRRDGHRRDMRKAGHGPLGVPPA